MPAAWQRTNRVQLCGGFGALAHRHARKVLASGGFGLWLLRRCRKPAPPCPARSQQPWPEDASGRAPALVSAVLLRPVPLLNAASRRPALPIPLARPLRLARTRSGPATALRLALGLPSRRPSLRSTWRAGMSSEGPTRRRRCANHPGVPTSRAATPAQGGGGSSPRRLHLRHAACRRPSSQPLPGPEGQACPGDAGHPCRCCRGH